MPGSPASPPREQIAAEIRRRPAGAVIADICRDLGILPHHPLWHEISMAILRHGGRFALLFKDICDQLVLFLAPGSALTEPAASPAPSLLSPAPAGTGPP